MDSFQKFIALIITFYSLFFPCSVRASLKLGNDAFVAFVKGPLNFEQFCVEQLPTESKFFLAQFYGIHLGILHHMRKNWQCDSFRQQKCEKYGENLDILYEYFFNVYAGHGVVTPIFLRPDYYGQAPQEIDLAKVVAHFADTKNFTRIKHEEYTEIYTDVEYWDGKIENYVPALKIELHNGEDLVYYKENAKEKSEKEKLEREKFEKIMEKMLERLEEKAKEKAELAKEDEAKEILATAVSSEESSSETVSSEESSSEAASSEAASSGVVSSEESSSEAASSSALPSVDIYDVVSDLPKFNFDDMVEDEAFVQFLQGEMKQEANINEIEEYERDLVYLHLMKKKWKWENLVIKPRFCPVYKIVNKYKFEKKLRVLNILYEYLFRVRYGIDAVKPIFEIRRLRSKWEKHKHRSKIIRLTTLLNKLDNITDCYFGFCGCLPNEDSHQEREITLLNGEELNYTANSVNESLDITFEEQLVLMVKEVCDRKNGEQNEPQINADELEGLLIRGKLDLANRFSAELKALHGKWVGEEEDDDEEEEEYDEEEEEQDDEEEEEQDDDGEEE